MCSPGQQMKCVNTDRQTREEKAANEAGEAQKACQSWPVTVSGDAKKTLHMTRESTPSKSNKSSVEESHRRLLQSLCSWHTFMSLNVRQTTPPNLLVESPQAIILKLPLPLNHSAASPQRLQSPTVTQIHTAAGMELPWRFSHVNLNLQVENWLMCSYSSYSELPKGCGAQRALPPSAVPRTERQLIIRAAY